MLRPGVPALRLSFAVATILLAAFIAYQSTRPPGDPTVPVLKSWLSYAGHLGVYAALAFCAHTSVWRHDWTGFAVAVLGCSLFGLALEVYQGSIEGRASTPVDALSNIVGSMLGAGLAHISQLAADRLLTVQDVQP
jgi:VanZ family protein